MVNQDKEFIRRLSLLRCIPYPIRSVLCKMIVVSGTSLTPLTRQLKCLLALAYICKRHSFYQKWWHTYCRNCFHKTPSLWPYTGWQQPGGLVVVGGSITTLKFLPSLSASWRWTRTSRGSPTLDRLHVTVKWSDHLNDKTCKKLSHFFKRSKSPTVSG